MVTNFHKQCKELIKAFKEGDLGQTIMPEDSCPKFKKSEQEMRLAYFTLPMALNYQRDSYKLWQSALKTFSDKETKFVFDLKEVSKRTEAEIRIALMKYKLALQPNKHINTWSTIAKTIYKNWGSFSNLLQNSNNDFLVLRQKIQGEYKKDFPYLSGPKIFNYWSYILSTYGKIDLKNKNRIEIAPDTHVVQCSLRLKVITEAEAREFSKNQIAERWRSLLEGSGIDPIDMHSPLWFWSRNGFLFELE